MHVLQLLPGKGDVVNYELEEDYDPAQGVVLLQDIQGVAYRMRDRLMGVVEAVDAELLYYDQIPPQALEEEQKLLGYLLVSDNTGAVRGATAIYENLDPTAFYRAEHGALFNTLRASCVAGVAIPPSGIAGLPSGYLETLFDARCNTAEEAFVCCRRIEERHECRKIIKACATAVRLCHSGGLGRLDRLKAVRAEFRTALSKSPGSKWVTPYRSA